jgi:hypothetical protein
LAPIARWLRHSDGRANIFKYAGILFHTRNKGARVWTSLPPDIRSLFFVNRVNCNILLNIIIPQQ